MYSEWYSPEGAGETEFLIRGLTVNEMLEFISSRERSHGLGHYQYTQIANKCIEGWKGIVDSDDTEIQFSDQNKNEVLNYLPSEMMVDIGKKALEELTYLNNEDEERLKGFVRWSMWLSEKNEKAPNENRANQFDCKLCIEGNRWMSKKCGLSPEERERRSFSPDIDDEDEDFFSIEEQLEAESRLDNFKSRRKSKQKYHYNKAEEKKTKDGFNLHGDVNFKFPECPVSWIPSWMRMVAEVMLYCEQKNLSYFKGGVGDQLYRTYNIGRIVSSEYNKIENEKYEKEKNKK